MKLSSECSGECCICLNGDFCLAGHGDDWFEPAEMEQVIARLNKGKYADYRTDMVLYLHQRYDYIWQAKTLDEANDIIQGLLKHKDMGRYELRCIEERERRLDIEWAEKIYKMAERIAGIRAAKTDGGEKE